MLEFLQLPQVQPYLITGVITATLFVILAALTLIGVGFDGFDFGDDIDLDSPDIGAFDVVMNWLGIRGIPLTVVVPVYFLMFTTVGFLFSATTYNTLGYVPDLLIFPVAVTFFIVTRLVFGQIAKYWPEEFSAAFDKADLYGLEATINEPTTDKFVGSAYLTVNGNKTFITVLSDDSNISEIGAKVRIIDNKDGIYIVSNI